MSQKKHALPSPSPIDIEKIKITVVTAMFSDDYLFENLVLKGGNALNLIHKLGSRSSVDLDFSMQHDLDISTEQFRVLVERTLKRTFLPLKCAIFDVKLEEKPHSVSQDMADFWGGYAIEFKIIDQQLYEKLSNNLVELRRNAIGIGQGKKFLIDVSRFEYVTGKQETELDGFRIYAYSPEMIVCEKLRAICQQMPDYGPIIKRSRAGSARAKDFYDIYILISALGLDMNKHTNKEIIVGMFDVKNVPIQFLGKVKEFRTFHQAAFQSVIATVAPGTDIKDFDFYFDFVLNVIDDLKPLWDK